MAETKKTGRARTCPSHGAEWDYPRRHYKCMCAMDKWTWERAMAEAKAEDPRPERAYVVLGEDDGYHD